MKRIIISMTTVFACTIFLFCCQQLTARQIQSPYIKALQLHGDVSSLKIYSRGWSTKFGEREFGSRTLKSTLYFDKNHRLLYVTDNRYHYFYEYEYVDGILSTIDCYVHRIDVPTSYNLEFKIKFVKENDVIVSHVYDDRGTEIDKYSPYNVYPMTYFSIINPYPEAGYRYAGNYFYLFAFEIMPKTYESGKNDICEFNSAGQMTVYKDWIMTDERGNDYYDSEYSYEYNSAGQLVTINYQDVYPQHVTLDYDTGGNIVSIDKNRNYGSNNEYGETYIYEFEYGKFEESEKFRRENFLNEIARQEAVRDSIARAKKLAAEQAVRDKEAAEKLAEKQKWEQRLPIIREFASAMTNPSYKSRYSISVSQDLNNRIIILYHDYGRAQISAKEFDEYSDDAGNNYNVYCNEELSSMVFSSGSGKAYLVRKLGDSFQVYDISAYVDL